ncbi:glycosyltransferase [Sulfurimonas sp. NWX367]|uniref:glycosyltransferase n=1 Tax=Sulfurimonas sp. NWX367 TaxID=2925413 RepID=UPI00320462B3
MFEDTYFLDFEEAIRIASQQNRQNLSVLQACYYAGEKIETDFENLIHLPFESFVDTLSKGVHRLPTKIDFTNLDISDEVKEEIEDSFQSLLTQTNSIRKILNEEYVKALKNRKLNFNEPWRFYLTAHSNSQVLQYVAKAIAETLESMGYSVFFDLRNGTEDMSCSKNIFLFNPHVTINLNAMNTWQIADDVFNFVWFQDPMPFLMDGKQVQIRKKDFVFSLLPIFDEMLKRKGIPFERQGFCINEKIYKNNPEIKREKKIVFIGSSYLKSIPYKENIKLAVKELEKIFLEGDSFTDELTALISEKYELNVNFVSTRLIPYIVRDIGLLKLCKINSDYKIEIYGHGWDVYEELKPYYKGSLKYGKEIANVYNSATFAFAPHQQYTLQQRTFEASACGAIPIVYDCREISDEDSYEEALCYYKTTQDLEKILTADIPEKDFSRLLQSHTYKSFAKKILKIIEDNK